MSTTESDLMDAFEESMQECFEDFDDQFEHETIKNYVPYGNTQVVESEYPTEQSLIRCSEAFKQDFDVFKFIEEYLQENQKFLDTVQEYVKKNY